MLVAAGARLNVMNDRSYNPIMESANEGRIESTNYIVKNNPDLLELPLSNCSNCEKDNDASSSSVEIKESPLSVACFNGNYEIVKLLLEEGSKFGLRQDELFTSLLEACMDGHIEVVKLLLDYGADLRYNEHSCDTPLSISCNGGHFELVKLLLDRGANIEETNEEGVTPLMEASREGHLNVVQLLLSHRAEINTMTDETFETALTLACSAGWFEIAIELIKNGASIELGSPTPLIEASSVGHIEIVKYLLNAGANVNASTSALETAIIAAADNGNLDIVKLLISSHAEVDHTTVSGYSALMKAARSGHFEIVDLLLKHNVDVNRQTNDNDATVLSCACVSGNVQIVKLLLQHGADPLHVLKDNLTTLMECSRGGFVNIAMLLLDPTLIWSENDSCNNSKLPEISSPQLNKLKDSNSAVTPKNINQINSGILSKKPPVIDAKKNSTSTSIDLSIDSSSLENGALSKCKISEPKSSNITNLQSVSKSKTLISTKKTSKKLSKQRHSSSNSSLSRKLFGNSSNSIDINTYSELTNETALTIACTSGHYDMAIFLITRGALIEQKDRRGYTPLMICSYNGSIKICSRLLEIGANIEACCEKNKETALTLACSTGRYEIVKLLVERGANIEHRTVSDYTALSIASNHGHMPIINYLLEKGADVNPHIATKHGLTPLMLACMCGHVSVVRVLLDNGANPSVEINKNTALSLACVQGKMDIVHMLINHKVNIEHRSKTGLTPLMEAANNGHIEVGVTLIKAGADVNASSIPSTRETPLSIAAEKGHEKFVEMLIKNKANIEFRNKRGCTALWLAASNGHLNTVKMLDSYGAHLNVVDGRDISALVAAFRRGHQEIVKYLVKKVTHFPSDNDCKKFINSLNDKDIQYSVISCYKIIMQEKEKQEKEADKNATDFLNELSLEKAKKDEKKAVQPNKKKDKKKKKKSKTTAEASISSPATSNKPTPVEPSNTQKIDPETSLKSSSSITSRNQADMVAQSPNTQKARPPKLIIRPTESLTSKDNGDESSSDSEEWKQISRKSGSVKLENIRKSTKAMIPSNLVSRFIGKGGSSINLIREATHTSVEIDTSKKSPNGDCTIIIKGLSKDIRSVISILNAIINEPERSTQSIVADLDNVKRVSSPATHVVVNSKDYRPNTSMNAPNAPVTVVKQNKPIITQTSNSSSFLYSSNPYQTSIDISKKEIIPPILTYSKPIATTLSMPAKNNSRDESSTTVEVSSYKREPAPKIQPIVHSNVVWSTTADTVNVGEIMKPSSNVSENLQSNYHIQYPPLTSSESQRTTTIIQPIKSQSKPTSLCPGSNRPVSQPNDSQNYTCPLLEHLLGGKYEVGVQFDKAAWNLTSSLSRPSSTYIANILKNGFDSIFTNEAEKDTSSKDSFFINSAKPFPNFQADLNPKNDKGVNSSAPSWFGPEDCQSESINIDIESFFTNK